MNKKKILSLIMALVMLVGVFSPLTALAAEGDAKKVQPAGTLTEAEKLTKTVTLHKMLMTKEDIKVKGREVTVNTAAQGQEEKLETKFVVAKLVKNKEGNDVTEYYANGTKLDENNATDKLFIQGYSNGEAVFASRRGLNGEKYSGKEITNIAGYFGTNAKEMENVFFAWQVKGHEKNAQGKEQYIKAITETKEGKVVTKIDNGLISPLVKETEPNGKGKGFKYEVEYTTDLDQAFGGKTTATGIKFATSKLPAGEYLIQEIKEKSTYVGEGKDKEGKKIAEKSIVDQRAVPVEITLPLVNNEGVVVDAHVYPKNVEDKPEIDKNFKDTIEHQEVEKEKDKADKSILEKNKAVNTDQDDKNDVSNMHDGAQYDNKDKNKARATVSVGDKVPYEVKTKIAAGTSYENLTWNDIMTNGLTYNKDLTITVNNNITLVANTDYELVQDDNGFRLKMHKSGLEKIEKVTKGTDQKDVEITLTYSATVNGTAKVDNPEKNNVTLEYGHKPGKDLEEKPVKPKNGELKVTKNFENGVNTDGLRLVYSLKNGNNEVATVALDNTMTSGTINLGNGITFVIDGAFNGTFKGLPDGNDYKITERVAGYNPDYAKTNNDGEVTITNKKDNDNPPPEKPTTPEVVVGGKKFVKTDDKDATANDIVRLAGAKFAVKSQDGKKYLAVKSVDTVESEKKKVTDAKEELDKAVKEYNERKDDTNKDNLAKAIETAQKSYNEAFKTAGTRYEWANSKDEKGKTILTLVSNKDGQFEIEGLAYGKYKLEEIEAPKGFAKISDIEFEIAKGSTKDVNIKYATSDKEVNAKQIRNKTVSIPQTGGMGTVLFTVVGISLMAGAVIAIRKNREEA